MFYEIKEGEKSTIKCYDGIVDITVEDFTYLFTSSAEKIISDMIKKDEMLKFLNVSSEIYNIIINAVIFDKDNNNLKQKLTVINFPLYSIIINSFNTYKRKYNAILALKEASCINLSCTKDSFLKTINLVKNSNNHIIIDCFSISLEEYYVILSGMDFNEFENLNIKIHYQKHNSPISLSELYRVSGTICKISKEIRKYNMSPMEKVMYVYDLVKKRIYKEDDVNKKNSRDLDKVLVCDAIVCVGYSNLFNAILKCLGFNVDIFINRVGNGRHQRSLVYINDTKYNIDGIYVFDPTFDSKKKNDSNNFYIENYDFFAMTLKESKFSCLEEMSDVLNYSLVDLCIMINNQKSLSEATDLFDQLSKFYNILGFTDFDLFSEKIVFYQFLSKEEQIKLESLYNEIIKKSVSRSIIPTKFINILYNTRRIQYYNNLIDRLSIEDIEDTTIYKYVTLKVRETRRNKCTPERSLLEVINYQESLEESFKEQDSVINSYDSSVSVERDIKNIELTKVLKKVRDICS